MCPGGFIVPATTAPGEVVVNGMSPSRRDSKYANSGIVTAIELPEDLGDYKDTVLWLGSPSSKKSNSVLCRLAGGTQTAPAQRMIDFVNRKVSSKLNDTSYQPGLKSMEMDAVFAQFCA